MIINKLNLENFGIYKDRNVFVFSNEKPVVLIAGMNGRGKTTFLEAVLLALYGKRSPSFIETKKSFRQYIKNLVCRSAQSHTCVEISFTMQADNGPVNYRVRRTWSMDALTLKTTVYKEDIYDELLSDNWDSFIDELLPSAIAPFFFFDGEKITEIANAESNVYIKDSIKRMLGIDYVDQSIADLNKIVRKKYRVSNIHTYSNDIQVLENDIEKLTAAIKETETVFEKAKKEKLKISVDREKAESRFIKIGGKLAEKKGELQARRVNISEQINRNDELLQEYFSGDAPLIMVREYLNSVHEKAEGEKKNREIQIVLRNLSDLYKSFNAEKKSDFAFEDFLKFIEASSPLVSENFRLSEEGNLRLQTLCRVGLEQRYEEGVRLFHEREKLLREQEEIEKYIVDDIMDESIDATHKQLMSLAKDEIIVEEKIKSIEDDLNKKRAEQASKLRQQHGLIEKAVRMEEENDDVKRVIKYAEYGLRVFEEYQIRLQKAKSEELADAMTKCFNIISAKKNLIGKISIDPKTLDFIYLDERNSEISQESLSAGEKQLLVISMLWALEKCSNKDLPVIIDTPLARLDNVHRELLLKNYFPFASKQTILLSTDSEVYGGYYTMIKPYVATEYTLVYNEQEERTFLKEGFFKEDSL